MNGYSEISLIACVIYLSIGVYVYRLDRKSKQHFLFFLYCAAMALWSFAYAFVYVTNEAETIWMEISALGWCTFSSLILHIVLIITGNRFAKNRLVQGALYIPSAVFLYIAVVPFWKISQPAQWVQDFFYTGDFLYHSSYLLLSMILLARWGIRSESRRIKRQALILVLSGILPFFINLMTQHIMKKFGAADLPALGHVYSLITMFGVNFAMTKYRFFDMKPTYMTEDILAEMMDLVFLVSPEGRIVWANASMERLLRYSKKELIGMPLEKVLGKEAAAEIFRNRTGEEICRIAEVQCVSKAGEAIPVSLSYTHEVDPNLREVEGILIVGHDISLQKMYEQELGKAQKAEAFIAYLADHDSLTALPNRKLFYQKLRQKISRANEAQESFAVLFLDVDDLKPVNDRFGHDAGDALLCETAERLRGALGPDDLAARIGGDEFAVLVSGVPDRERTAAAAEELAEMINRPFVYAGRRLDISVSIGAGFCPDDGNEPDLLMKVSDTNMYRIKNDKKEKRSAAAG